MKRLAILALVLAGCGGKTSDGYEQMDPCPAGGMGAVRACSTGPHSLVLWTPDLAGQIIGVTSAGECPAQDHRMDTGAYHIVATTTGATPVILCSWDITVKPCKARILDCGE